MSTEFTANFPSISIVTPSYNQGRFLQATIDSVVSQKYPKLEYFIIDGGSSDESVQIIQRNASSITGWVSEKDNGQYRAIEKGFARTSGEILGWLNSDDMHTPWTLSIVGEIFANFPEVQWLTTLYPMRWDLHGRAVACRQIDGFARKAFLRGNHLPGSQGFFAGMVQQESTFWRRKLWEDCGSSFYPSLDNAADFELWMRFSGEAELYGIATPLAGFRMHGTQKTKLAHAEYHREAVEAWKLHGGSYPPLPGKIYHIIKDRLPAGLRPMAGKLGLLSPAKKISRRRDNAGWEISDILV